MSFLYPYSSETYHLETSLAFVSCVVAIGAVPSFARTMRHKNRNRWMGEWMPEWVNEWSWEAGRRLLNSQRLAGRNAIIINKEPFTHNWRTMHPKAMNIPTLHPNLNPSDSFSALRFFFCLIYAKQCESSFNKTDGETQQIRINGIHLQCDGGYSEPF